MPGTTTVSRDNLGHPSGALRDGILQLNKLILDVDAIRNALAGAEVLLPTVLSIGTTVTLALSALTITVNGVPVLVAAQTAQAFGALGTIAASRWSVIAVDAVAAGTISFAVSANYAAGFATEALALLDKPPRIAGKARIGYITVLASASTWITGTDALAGGAGGNPATTTNYYPTDGVMQATGAQLNGMIIPTVLSRGSSDTNVASTACTFNILGAPKTKVAVAAGTAFGALGTVPADQWAILALDITAAGVISYVSGAANYTTGYLNEGQAILALPAATTGKARLGYITLKTKAATAWIAGTDGLAGGSTGNFASVTNYYPAAGLTTVNGMQASQVGDGSAAITS